MQTISTLSYNKEIDRFCIGTRDLHCGDCFEVKNGEEWEAVRIEYSDHWYLIGTKLNINDIYQNQIQVKINM